MKNNTNEIAYRMPVGVAKAYLKSRHGDENKMNNQAYLCKMVNQDYGLKGNCVKVIID